MEDRCLAGGEWPDQAADGLTAARPCWRWPSGSPGFFVGAPVKGGAAGKWVIPLAYPVRGGDGRAAGMVIAAAQLDRFQSMVTSLELTEQPTSLILKSEGLVIASSRDPDRYVGHSRRDDALIRTMIDQRSGVLRGTAIDGIERIYGFHAVAGTDWLAVVGLDVDPIREKVIASALRHGAYGLGVLVLALALSFALGRRISAPIAA